MRHSTWLCIVVPLTALAACATDEPTGLPRDADLPFATGTFGPTWSIAMSIELDPPGAAASFNTTDAEGCPFISADGKMFFMASNRPGGVGATKNLDIWVSTRPNEKEPWGAPSNVAPVNSDVDDFCPTIARDGHTFYFVSRRAVGVAGVDYCGGADIYVTRRRDDWTFDAPRNLGCQLNSPEDEFSPFPLEEQGTGPVLYFSSTRPGLGTGGDLYRSESHGGEFGPASLVPGVNSPVDDGQPNLRRDGLELFFYSRRSDLPGAQGGADLYLATRASTSAEWSTPVNLGPAVNSPVDETRPSLSWDGTTLYFGSPRAAPLGEGSSDIFVTRRAKLTGDR